MLNTISATTQHRQGSNLTHVRDILRGLLLQLVITVNIFWFLMTIFDFYEGNHDINDYLGRMLEADWYADW